MQITLQIFERFNTICYGSFELLFRPPAEAARNVDILTDLWHTAAVFPPDSPHRQMTSLFSACPWLHHGADASSGRPREPGGGSRLQALAALQGAETEVVNCVHLRAAGRMRKSKTVPQGCLTTSGTEVTFECLFSSLKTHLDYYWGRWNDRRTCAWLKV